MKTSSFGIVTFNKKTASKIEENPSKIERNASQCYAYTLFQFKQIFQRHGLNANHTILFAIRASFDVAQLNAKTSFSKPFSVCASFDFIYHWNSFNRAPLSSHHITSHSQSMFGLFLWLSIKSSYFSSCLLTEFRHFAGI